MVNIFMHSRALNNTAASTPAFPGLSHEEAARRLLEYGENTIYHRERLRPIIAFIKKFNSPLLLMLIGAALISYFFEQRVNATIILVMVLMSAILDFVNTHKSERVAEALVARVQSTATVWRDGKKEEIPFRFLVPGDMIELSSGDVIPADCLVRAADDFFVNQSSLTGESFPVEKRAVTEESDTKPLAVGDEHAVFMGTSVVTGRATGEVRNTGAHAEFGKIAARLSGAEAETSFDRGLKEFSLFIMRLTFVMILVVFAVNAYFGREILDSFIFAMAIAVGITPELLPVIMSVALSHGSLIMAKKNVIVKNLGAVQNFGGMNILCTDKTGTLTEDKITLVKCVDLADHASPLVLQHVGLSSRYQTIRKGPLDVAIEEHGTIDLDGYTKVDEVPFDFTRRRDSIIAGYKGGRLMITKGAPESITTICDFVMDGDKRVAWCEEEKKKVREEYDRLSADGFRVLGVAMKTLPEEERVVYHHEEEEGMTFLGFAAFLDPPKQSAGLALRELAKLSIEVKIITGDSEVLTEHICRDLGFVITGVLTGDEVAKLSDSELTQKVQSVNVFARTSPEQKERIVTVLRHAGNTVGYLGDGINDAPVLRAADVGISVNNAVDVAKETADIILLDKSLSVLADGVVEGRKTFQNTLKYIKMGFSSNFGNMFSMMGASVFLPFLPMLPSQILLNNFLYDLSGTTLPTDHTDPESMQKPLKWNMRDFSKYILVFGVVSSLFDFLTFYLLFTVFHLSEMHFQTGWFIESIATQVLIIFIIRTKRTPFWTSRPSVYVFLSAVGMVVFAWAIPYTPLGALFSFAILSPTLLFAIIGIVAVYLVVGETVKYFFYRRYALAP